MPNAQRPAYPPARRGGVVDDFFGTPVPDPYRWLETLDSPETQDWLRAQRAMWDAYLAGDSCRDALHARLVSLSDYPREGVPLCRGGRQFTLRNSGLQPQPALWVEPGADEPARVLLDPNGLSDRGTASLTTIAPSGDGRWLAYGVSHSGSDWQTLRVREVDGDRDLPDEVRWCRFAAVAWHPDGTGFYYNRFPEPGTVAPEDGANHARVYWHALGTRQDEDRLVFARDDAKTLGFRPCVSEDGRHLILHVHEGTDPRNGLYHRPLASTGEFARTFEPGGSMLRFIDSEGDALLLHTDLDAPRGRVVAVDLARPQPEHWRTLVPETADTLASVHAVGGRLVAVTLHRARHEVRLFQRDGRPAGRLPLPEPASVLELGGAHDGEELFVSVETFQTPPQVYRCHLPSGDWALHAPTRVPPSAADVAVKQVSFPSKDGTPVSMFVLARRSTAPAGPRPTLLYGYGGFNISLTPAYQPLRALWLELGGVLAIPNLRGGGEYGEAWHRAGMLERKQNVFDDFIAAAEWLQAEGTTTPQRLAIHGRSNGGLLVSACLVQRPELFGAVLCGVPVADMLRYHRFTVGRYWIPEYGNAEADAAQFDTLRAYSPLHSVRPGTAHPPTLCYTAETDDRVVPAHAMKLVAALQAADAGAGPILLRFESHAGHGLGKPTAKVIDEQADLLAFVCRELDVAVPSD